MAITISERKNGKTQGSAYREQENLDAKLMLKYESISYTLNTLSMLQRHCLLGKKKNNSESKLEELQMFLKTAKEVKVERNYFVSLPTEAPPDSPNRWDAWHDTKKYILTWDKVKEWRLGK